MLYEAYVAKLERQKRIFMRFWHLRFVFLAVFLLILAGIGALLGVEGIVTSVSVPQSVIYGEDFSPTAEAIFGETEFEYRAVGTETWSREQPRTVGEYECRAVGKSVLNTDRPGESQRYTILPRSAEVRIRASSLVYGERPDFFCNTLQYGDTITVGHYRYAQNDGKIELMAEVEDIRVQNTSGEDVTACYSFTAVPRTVDDVPRPIVFRTPSATFVYDGNAHGDENAEIGGEGLLEGHRAVAEFPVITEAGSVRNTPQNLHILDEEGNDVTGRYAISQEVGTLTVERRSVTLTTASAQFTYDGQEHRFDAVTAEEGMLADGQEIVVTQAVFAQNVGSYPYTPEFHIGEEGTDVSGNYIVTRNFGEITVNARPITVTTGDESFTYDGQEHEFDEVTAEEGMLASGQEIHVTQAVFAEHVGNYPYTPTFRIEEEGTDVTRNYAVTRDFGEITVNARPITVTTGDETFTYDGQEHRFNAVTAEEGMLASGQVIRVTQAVIAQNVGSYPYAPIFRIEKAGADVTRNYEITENFGEIKVEVCPIKVKTQDGAFTYDGQGHTFSGVELMEGDLARGHSVRARGNVFGFENVSDSGKENIFEVAVFYGGQDVSQNYAIECTYGTVTVERRSVVVTTETHTFTYDGQEHAFEGCSSNETYGLVRGHTLQAAGEVPTFCDVTVASSGNNVFPVSVYSNGEDVSANYVISYSYGTVTVLPRPVYATTGSHSWVYDGEVHFEEGVTLADFVGGENGSGLAVGHTCTTTVTSHPTVKRAGERVENALAVSFLFVRDGEDVSSNYAPTIQHFGTIEVTKRPIVVTTGTEQFPYDGQGHSYGVFTPEQEGAERGLLAGHEVRISGDVPTFTNVWETASRNNVFSVAVFGTEDETENYRISYTYGTVTITPRALSVTTETNTVTYDGQGHLFSSCYSGEEEGLVRGQEVRAIAATVHAFRNVWETAENNNIFAVSVFGGGEELTRNYVISYTYGTVTVTKRQATVETGSDVFVYDGTPHAFAQYTANEFVVGHSVQVKPDTLTQYQTVRDSGKENIFEVYVLDGGQDVTENYDISYTYGEVTVLPRPVKLKTGSYTGYYDGQAHFSEEVSVDENAVDNFEFYGIAQGQRLEISARQGVISVTEVRDSKENIFTFTPSVFANGEDVTENYSFSSEVTYGVLTVLPRPIKLKTGSYTGIYDGKAHSNEEVTVDEAAPDSFFPLVEGHTLVISSRRGVPSIQNVRDSGRVNRFTFDVRILFGTEDKTENYAVSEEVSYGSLTLTPRPVLVTTETNGFTYDGQGHPYDAVTPEEEDASRGLVNGQSVQAKEETVHAFTNVRETREANNVFEVFFTHGEEDVTDNYIISYQYGTVTISPRPVTVRTKTETVIYDGQWHTYGAETFAGGQEQLVSGHAFNVTGGTYSFINVNGEELPYTNAPTVTVYADGEDMSENYTISYEYGEVTIAKRPITVATKSETFVYDGQSHSYGVVSWLTNGDENGLWLADGHSFSISGNSSLFTFTSAGTYSNAPEIGINGWYSPTSGNVTSNYDITFRYGTITIKKRPIRLVSPTVSWVYDGLEHAELVADTSSVVQPETDRDRGLVPSHSVQAVSYPHIIGFCENVENRIEYRIYGFGLSKDLTNNYEIEYVRYGTITVEKRQAEIVSGSQVFVYDGEEHDYLVGTSEWSEERGVVGHHRIEISEGPVVRDITDTIPFGEKYYSVIGTVPNVFALENIHIFDSQGNDVTENYILTCNNSGTLRVKSPVYIYLFSLEKPYDGEPLLFGEGDFDIDQLPAGVSPEDIHLHFSPASIVKAGEKRTLADIRLLCSGEVSGDPNNRFVFIDQTYLDTEETDGIVLSVIKRPITITTGSLDAVRTEESETLTYRDGEGAWELTGGASLPEGFQIVCYITGELSPLEAQAENTLSRENVFIYDGEGNDVTENFELTIVCGTLRWIDDEEEQPTSPTVLPVKREELA